MPRLHALSFSTFLIMAYRVPPKKQLRILLRSLQSFLRTFPRLKGALSTWLVNHMVYVLVYQLIFGPHGGTGL
jgi:hypothetical protein